MPLPENHFKNVFNQLTEACNTCYENDETCGECGGSGRQLTEEGVYAVKLLGIMLDALPAGTIKR